MLLLDIRKDRRRRHHSPALVSYRLLLLYRRRRRRLVVAAWWCCCCCCCVHGDAAKCCGAALAGVQRLARSAHRKCHTISLLGNIGNTIYKLICYPNRAAAESRENLDLLPQRVAGNFLDLFPYSTTTVHTHSACSRAFRHPKEASKQR